MPVKDSISFSPFETPVMIKHGNPILDLYLANLYWLKETAKFMCHNTTHKITDKDSKLLSVLWAKQNHSKFPQISF